MSTGKYAFSKALREVRFLFCQGEASAATRSFLSRSYPTMKKNNPDTPILLREAAGTLPKVYARYELGREKSQSLEGLTDKQIEDAVTTLVRNGETGGSGASSAPAS
ncbi:thioredoxin-like protein [Microdochium bolleyi]|uniref:Thioredoxin-like protein n=1 Tax=Microdochium bolleyi TaxID=196109 RepID=A0A136J9B3_9PEZI|nr:thioredoxin-like protein [Microdochium bolleyi]